MNKSSKNQSRLGLLLIKNSAITPTQLKQGLIYQSKRQIKLGAALIELNYLEKTQLNSILRKQSWIRSLTTCAAIVCSPMSTSYANDKSTHDQAVSSRSGATNLKVASALPSSVQLPQMAIHQPSFPKQIVDYYYSGSKLDEKEFTNLPQQPAYQIGGELSENKTSPVGVSFNKHFSRKSGMQLSFFSTSTDSFNTNTDHAIAFDPQISLYRSTVNPISNKYRDYTTTDKRNDRYSNSIPVVFMLTLKGRCLYENTGKKVETWSLNKAKHGVQRKAQLMFSVTKRF